MTTATPTPGQKALAALNTFLATLASDALIAAAGPINSFAASIQKTPTQDNLIAQAMLVPPAALAAAPTVEAEGIAALGVAIAGISAAAQEWAASKLTPVA